MMRDSQALFSRIWIAPVALATVLGFTLLTWGQEAQTPGGPEPEINATGAHSGSIASDWTHHHVIFSQLGTADGAQRNGTYDRWLKITNDPRYALQQLNRGGTGPELQGVPQPTPAEVEPMLNPDTTGEVEVAAEAEMPMTWEDFPGGVLPRGLARSLIPPRS